MYYIVYLTSNLINQKIYVGVHSTYNLNDGYLGSGKNIRRSIKKYGKENFNRQILFYCLTYSDALAIEQRIVDSSFLNLSNTYNLVLGGKGGDITLRKGKTYEEIYGIEKAKERRKIQAKGSMRLHSEESKVKCSISNKLTKANKDYSKSTVGKFIRSEETKQKLSENAKNRTKEHTEKIRLSVINRPKIRCDYCNQEFSKTNFLRWHGEKCKVRKKE